MQSSRLPNKWLPAKRLPHSLKQNTGMKGVVEATQGKPKGPPTAALLVNDPSAGSPTETLLRLLLPLNDQVCPTFQHPAAVASSQGANPRASLSHSIGSSDGRCVQHFPPHEPKVQHCFHSGIDYILSIPWEHPLPFSLWTASMASRALGLGCGSSIVASPRIFTIPKAVNLGHQQLSLLAWYRGALGVSRNLTVSPLLPVQQQLAPSVKKCIEPPVHGW